MKKLGRTIMESSIESVIYQTRAAQKFGDSLVRIKTKGRER